MRQTSHLFILLFVATSAAAQQRTITLANGRKLEDAKILVMTDKEITIQFERGFRQTVVKLEELRPEDQAKLRPQVEAARAARERNEAKLAKSAVLTTRSGQSFQGIVETQVEGDKLRVVHNGGVTRIPLTDLPDDLLNKMNLGEAKPVLEGDSKLWGKREVEFAVTVLGANQVHEMRGTVMEQRADGIILLRGITRKDILPKVQAFVPGVKGKSLGDSFIAKVKRAGVWADEAGQTFANYEVVP
jgi:hypothetical protein